MFELITEYFGYLDELFQKDTTDITEFCQKQSGIILALWQ